MNHSPEFLKRLYRTMLRIRLCEESFVEPILTKEVRCPVHLYSGEEAVAAGVCANLTTSDHVFGTHRSHGHFLAMGGSMRELVAEVFCREGGCSKGRGGSMHLIDPAVGMMGAAPIVAGTIPLAVGAALASSVRQDGAVAVCFFGDGAAGEGVLYESMNFAALRKLPVVFVCENNLYSTHLPIRECRAKKVIHDVATPFGVAASAVDGNDVLAVFEAASAAVGRCRRQEGPAFLECFTYRLRGHVGPDDNIQGSRTDIRPRAEVARWRKRDPIVRLGKSMIESGVAVQADLDAVRLEVETEVADAVSFARGSSFPGPEGLAHYVFQS